MEELGIEKKYIPKIVKRLGKIGILGCAGDYKDRTSLTYFVLYDKITELMGVNPTPPESPQGLKEPLGGVNPTPVEGLKEPLAGVDLTPVGRSENPRTGIELELEKKNVNGNKQKPGLSVPHSVSKPKPTNPDEELEPLDKEKFDWAVKHGFWKQFAEPPASRFRKGCLDSETFNKQFRERKQKTDSRSDLHKAAFGIPRNEEEAARMIKFLTPSKEALAARAAEDLERQKQKAEEKRRYDAPRTCAHCKVVFKEILRDGYCSDCNHHHPDRELHWYICKCERCVVHRKAKTGKTVSA